MRSAALLGAAVLLTAGCSAEEPVPAWIAEQAVALPGVEEPLPAVARSFLVDAVGEARVVALGESRHDLREQTLLKGQLVRVLVEDAGFRGLILEESVFHAEALDRAIQPDGPSIDEALASLAGWYLWDTGEFRVTLAWLREFNGTRPPDDRVRLSGMDITAPAPAIRAVLAALRDAGYEGFEEDWFRLDLLDGGDWQGALQAMQSLPGEEAQAILAAHASLHIQLERTGVGEWPRFARLARAATDGQEMFLAADLAAMGEVREEGMAAVVLDLLETDLAGRRVVIWDHNLHAARATFRMPAVEADLTPLGSLLGQALGDDYLAVGAAFGQGSFPADLPPGERAFPVLSGETVDGAMAGADVGVCLLDLRTVDGEVAAWWNTARPSRAQEFEATLVPAKAFDLLFYTPEVTRSRPSPAALARYASR